PSSPRFLKNYLPAVSCPFTTGKGGGTREGSTPFSTTPHTGAPASARTALATCSRGVASARTTSTNPSERCATIEASAVASAGGGERQVGSGEAGTLLPQRAGDPDHRTVLRGPPQRARVPQPVQQHAVLLGGRALRIGQGHEPLVDGHLGPSALDALEERCPGPRYRLRNAGHDVLLSPGRPGCIRPAPSATPATTAPGPSPTRAGAGPWPAPAAPAPPPLP